ncbi:MAG: Gfo/Idh/MocA family oxidoreductase [Planctomycetota bacterium]|nr:Gfo/Idh/MocA family oxidoreductase [Planctomycetota bacterium]
MNTQTYRAGIIGLGFIGAGDQVSGDALGQQVSDLGGTHFSAYTNHPRIQLVSGSSRDAGRRKRFAAKSSASTFERWQDMLAEVELDIVSVATYAPFHAEIAAACAERGIRAIYCEKPIATTLPDAYRMLDACKQSGTLLVINHNLRFHPNCRRLRDFIARGGLGTLTSLSCQWGAGRLGNVGTHMFDVVMMVTGKKIEAVSGTLDLAGKPDCRGPQFHDPGGWGVMRLEGGIKVMVDAGDYSTIFGGITFNGNKGKAILKGGHIWLEVQGSEAEEWPHPEDEPRSMELATSELVQALDGTATFPYDAAEAVHTLEAILGFHASHARNAAWVDLPLLGEDREREVLSG